MISEVPFFYKLRLPLIIFIINNSYYLAKLSLTKFIKGIKAIKSM